MALSPLDGWMTLRTGSARREAEFAERLRTSGESFVASCRTERRRCGKSRSMADQNVRGIASCFRGAIRHSRFIAFKLYDTYGFPLDLTELMARERGLTVDTAGFEKHMEEQRARARAAQKKTSHRAFRSRDEEPTHFLGYDHDHTGADVQEVLSAEGQAPPSSLEQLRVLRRDGRAGRRHRRDDPRRQCPGASPTRRRAATPGCISSTKPMRPPSASTSRIELDRARRGAIQRHHTVTHLLHWALHEVVSKEATQKGSFVGPDKLTFDFNSAALTPAQVRDIERLVNERIVENAARLVDRSALRRRARARRHHAVLRRQIRRDRARRADRRHRRVRSTATPWNSAPAPTRARPARSASSGSRAKPPSPPASAASKPSAGLTRLRPRHRRHAAPPRARHEARHAARPNSKSESKACSRSRRNSRRRSSPPSQREAAGRAKDLLANAQTINGTPAIIANLGGRRRRHAADRRRRAEVARLPRRHRPRRQRERRRRARRERRHGLHRESAGRENHPAPSPRSSAAKAAANPTTPAAAARTRASSTRRLHKR